MGFPDTKAVKKSQENDQRHPGFSDLAKASRMPIALVLNDQPAFLAQIFQKPSLVRNQTNCPKRLFVEWKEHAM